MTPLAPSWGRPCVYPLPFSTCSESFVESRQFLPTQPTFGAPFAVTSFEFRHCQSFRPIVLSAQVMHSKSPLWLSVPNPLSYRQWRSQDLEVGARGLGNEGPPAGSRGRAPGGWFGGIASRKLIAVIKDIWLPNHAQFCVFSSTAQPGIFLNFEGGVPPPRPLAVPLDIAVLSACR